MFSVLAKNYFCPYFFMIWFDEIHPVYRCNFFCFYVLESDLNRNDRAFINRLPSLKGVSAWMKNQPIKNLNKKLNPIICQSLTLLDWLESRDSKNITIQPIGKPLFLASKIQSASPRFSQAKRSAIICSMSQRKTLLKMKNLKRNTILFKECNRMISK